MSSTSIYLIKSTICIVYAARIIQRQLVAKGSQLPMVDGGGLCAVCGARKSQFVGAGLMTNSSIVYRSKCLFRGITSQVLAPNYTSAYPRHGTAKSWSKPINRVDQTAYHHDLCCAKHKDTDDWNSICDKTMLESLDKIPSPTMRERADRSIVKPLNGTKVRFGLGVKKKFVGRIN